MRRWFIRLNITGEIVTLSRCELKSKHRKTLTFWNINRFVIKTLWRELLLSLLIWMAVILSCGSSGDTTQTCLSLINAVVDSRSTIRSPGPGHPVKRNTTPSIIMFFMINAPSLLRFSEKAWGHPATYHCPCTSPCALASDRKTTYQSHKLVVTNSELK